MKPETLHFLKELRTFGIKHTIPNVTEAVGRLLNMLILLRKPKAILEIGCANGYSTIWMAEAARKIGAIVHAIDFSVPTFEKAQKNLLDAGFSDTVQFYFGDAKTIIPQMPGSLVFDFVFVDGEKASYHDFWNVIQPKLNSESLIIFDDMIAFPQKTASFYEFTKSLSHIDQLLIPIDGDDGILMMFRHG